MLRRLAFIGSVVGALALAISIASVLIVLAGPRSQMILVAYALVPAIVGWYLPALLVEQHTGRWVAVAARRMVAVFVGLGLAAASLLILEPVFAVVVLTCSAEVIFGALTRMSAKRIDELYEGRAEFDTSVYRHDLLSTCALSLFGWLRGQLDRVAIVAIAGPTLLGSFTLSYAVARAPADAAMAGMSNMFRSELASGLQSSDQFRRLLARQYVRLIVVGTVCFLVSIILSFSLASFLGDDWRQSLSVVPLLASSVYTSGFVWSVNALLNHVGLAKRVYGIQWFEVCLSVLVGVVMVQSFVLGVAVLLIREFVGACLTSYVARRFVSRLTVARWAGASICSLAVSCALWFVVGA
ncbi:hypothetical protein V525_21705 [Gordonia alkanivorans CGMCC 6845]|uniref:Polysaccharide biosynthesis protein n=2 Tax=Gordonia alkanivorans TaxID=84096 RepID=W9DF34_9ACTN|nr:hypothetical protein V525_21705 [Gordonia alkanivorans CGMCC 6845]